MAGVKLEVGVENAQPVIEALQRLATSVERMGPVFADIGEYLLLAHDERWDRQESPEGAPWAALSDRSVARKRAKGKPETILVLDGHLKNLDYNATDEGLAFGTPWIYGATHQFGDEDRGIKARPFLGLSDNDRAEVLTLVTEWLDEQAGGAA